MYYSFVWDCRCAQFKPVSNAFQSLIAWFIAKLWNTLVFPPFNIWIANAIDKTWFNDAGTTNTKTVFIHANQTRFNEEIVGWNTPAVIGPCQCFKTSTLFVIRTMNDQNWVLLEKRFLEMGIYCTNTWISLPRISRGSIDRPLAFMLLAFPVLQNPGGTHSKSKAWGSMTMLLANNPISMGIRPNFDLIRRDWPYFSIIQRTILMHCCIMWLLFDAWFPRCRSQEVFVSPERPLQDFASTMQRVVFR